MIMLWSVIIGLLIGYLRGGKIENLAQIEFNYSWLIVAAILIQIIILPLLPGMGPLIGSGQSIFHIISYILIGIFIVFNWRVFQVLIIGAGAFLNGIVISLNGGYMPASPNMLQRAGKGEIARVLRETGQHSNVVKMGKDTICNFLGDLLYLPHWLPFSSAFSIGDLIISIGIILLISDYMQPSKGKR